MINPDREGTVVLAKCAKCGQTFGITMERWRDGIWHQLWAFKISDESASAEGYGDQMVSGQIVTEADYPGCPYCESPGWISCQACGGKLTCHDGYSTTVTCGWCGNTGQTQVAESFNLRGGGL